MVICRKVTNFATPFSKQMRTSSTYFTSYTYIIYVLLLLPLRAGAMQKVWQDVKVYHANQQMFEVTDVVVNDTATMLTMTAKGKPDTQFLIRRSSHLRDDRGRYYGLQSWDGIDVGRSVWMDERGEMRFTLSFAPLADGVRWVDLVESEVHLDGLRMLGISEGGQVDVARYQHRKVGDLFSCKNSFGSGEVTIRGQLKGYQSDMGHQSLFLCEESALADETTHAVASCHIREDGSFVLSASVAKASLMVLTSTLEGEVWQIPVFVHPADQMTLTISLSEGRVVDVHSKCKENHIEAMREVAILGTEFLVPNPKMASTPLTAVYESPAIKGKQIIEDMTRRHRGRYVEFVGLSAKTMVTTLNQLSNIRYDFYEHPDIHLVYLFDGKSVTRDYYKKFVERCLDEEDCHLLSMEDFSAVREFLLSRESSLVGTLNREGFPLLTPLNYNDEFEFRRRFRMILRTELDALSEEEQAMMDTMVEVPDSISLYYDREHTFGSGSMLIPQTQAQTEHRMLWATWWGMGVALLMALVGWIIYRQRRKKGLVAVDENLIVVDEVEDDMVEEPNQRETDQKAQAVDSFCANLVMAWANKKPKNAPFLEKLEKACPSLSKREQAMCLIYYSEKMADDKVMEILDIPSSSAYRTAKSRLRKKLKGIELTEIKNLNL